MSTKKPTAATLKFLRKHLRTDLAKKGYLTKWAGQAKWPFVDRVAESGLIEIVDPDNRFPYNWAGTRITDAGRAACAQSTPLRLERVMKHHVERTSPKGPGMPFIGTCRLCGKSGLKAAAALEDCENVRGLTIEEAMIETIMGDDATDPDFGKIGG